MKTIGLIIPNLNGRRFLGPCLESIAEQTRTPDELVVVDNGSTDGSLEYLRTNFPDVRLLEMGTNTGFSVAVNRAVESVSTDYVALLNNDTECDSHWLASLSHALDSNPDCGFCASKMLYYDQRHLLDAAGDLFNSTGFASKRGWLQVDTGQFDTMEPVFGACAGAAMYRKDWFDELGWFDEDFFAYQEDSDLSFRAQIAGISCLYVPSAVVYHHVGGTSKQSGTQFASRLKRLEFRNLVYVLVKNLPTSLWIRYGIPILLSQFFLIAGQMLKGQGSAAVLGYWDAIREFGNIRIKRNEIQDRRRVPARDLSAKINTGWISTLLEPYRRKKDLRRRGIQH